MTGAHAASVLEGHGLSARDTPSRGALFEAAQRERGRPREPRDRRDQRMCFPPEHAGTRYCIAGGECYGRRIASSESSSGR
jgi:hypothetical protein